MKTIIALLVFFTILSTNIFAQRTVVPEKFGNTLNLGLGIGYYRYVDNSPLVLHANYEFDIVRNFTLAPFIGYYSYTNRYYYYRYRTTIIPIGVKGSYYFDDLLKADSKWDFYAAGSLGFLIIKNPSVNYYYNDTRNHLYDLHIGTEYHFNDKVGMFLDISIDVFTGGLAIHF